MLTVTFWVLVGVFVLIMCELFCPVVRELFKGKLFLLPLIVFSLLGGVLTVLTLKKEVKGRLKTFLLLTGISALGFFVSVFLHNLFYGLEVIVSNINILSWLMNFFHVVFFMIAIFLCPTVFLIGMIGSVVLLMRKRKGKLN